MRLKGLRLLHHKRLSLVAKVGADRGEGLLLDHLLLWGVHGLWLLLWATTGGIALLDLVSVRLWGDEELVLRGKQSGLTWITGNHA